MTSLNLERPPSEDDKSFICFPSRRSVVHSTKGIVSSTQPLANEAGYKILAKGGNAADAAVAVAAALNVTGTTSREHTDFRTE
jgi:gamma-glutamyltranspeptidase/glutathione hydrolase